MLVLAVLVTYSSLLICNHAVTNRHVVDIPPMLMNLDDVFPFFPSRLQISSEEYIFSKLADIFPNYCKHNDEENCQTGTGVPF